MKLFTVDEANELIPTVTGIVQGLQGLQERLTTAVGEVAAFEARAAGNGHADVANPVLQTEFDIDGLRNDLSQGLMVLQGMGIHIKSIEHGILDFPTEMAGRVVYLCWQLGEERVSHWHGMDEGFAGRQPL